MVQRNDGRKKHEASPFKLERLLACCHVIVATAMLVLRLLFAIPASHSIMAQLAAIFLIVCRSMI